MEEEEEDRKKKEEVEDRDDDLLARYSEMLESLARDEERQECDIGPCVPTLFELNSTTVIAVLKGLQRRLEAVVQQLQKPPEMQLVLASAQQPLAVSTMESERSAAISSAIETQHSTSFADLAGLEAAKTLIVEAAILPARYPHLFTGARSPCNRILLYGPPGTGKCLGRDTMVLLADHSVVPVQEITTQHLLLGDDFGLRRVLSVCHGFGELFLVTPHDHGMKFVCNLMHILTILLVPEENVDEMCQSPSWPAQEVCGVIVDVPLCQFLAWSGAERRRAHLIRVPPMQHTRERKCVLVNGRELEVAAFSVQLHSTALGEYFGFTLDGNARFLLSDYTVTHNSHFARAVAGELSASLFALSPSSLLSAYVGESEKMIRETFAVARGTKGNVVLFLDEADSLTRSRGAHECEASRRVKTQLLQELGDGLGEVANRDGSSRLIFIAATNCPQELDVAFLRRFQKRILIPLPDLATRKQLLELLLRGEELSSQDMHQTAEMLEGYSGSDIKVVVSDAALEPVRELYRATHWRFEAHACDPVHGAPSSLSPTALMSSTPMSTTPSESSSLSSAPSLSSRSQPASPRPHCGAFWSPCAEGDAGAQQLSLADLPPDQVRCRALTLADFARAMQQSPPTVGAEHLLELQAFRDKYGG